MAKVVYVHKALTWCDAFGKEIGLESKLYLLKSLQEKRIFQDLIVLI